MAHRWAEAEELESGCLPYDFLFPCKGKQSEVRRWVEPPGKTYFVAFVNFFFVYIHNDVLFSCEEESNHKIYRKIKGTMDHMLSEINQTDQCFLMCRLRS